MMRVLKDSRISVLHLSSVVNLHLAQSHAENMYENHEHRTPQEYLRGIAHTILY